MAAGMNGLGEGLFHVKLGSQTCGMFQSWRLVRWVREKERGNGSWLCRCERGAGLWGPGCEWGGVGAGEEVVADGSEWPSCVPWCVQQVRIQSRRFPLFCGSGTIMPCLLYSST